jgi:hypothetical protein
VTTPHPFQVALRSIKTLGDCGSPTGFQRTSSEWVGDVIRGPHKVGADGVAVIKGAPPIRGAPSFAAWRFVTRSLANSTTIHKISAKSRRMLLLCFALASFNYCFALSLWRGDQEGPAN